MNAQQVGIGLSGGVDSAIAAHLLVRDGYRVTGFFMRLPVSEVDAQEQRARKVADSIGIPLEIVDLQHQFQQQVVQPFLQQYQQGRTPNPCVCCNRHIKFGLLARYMLDRGMDRVASGHYARVESKPQETYTLRRGVDQGKDQSYFLCRLGQRQLASMLLPLGDFHKDEVKTLAASMGLTDKVGTESQDVCFLEDGLTMFLVKHGHEGRPGEIHSIDGRVLGNHPGINRYTIGQRRGLGLPDATPWYVVRLDPHNNRVIVGKHDDLFTKSFYIDDLHWTGREKQLPWQGEVQLRSRHRSAPATLTRAGERWLVTCNESQRAVTPGQYAVFYDRDQVIASGIIDTNVPEAHPEP